MWTFISYLFLFSDAEDFEPGDFKNKPSDRWEGEDEDDVKVGQQRSRIRCVSYFSFIHINHQSRYIIEGKSCKF